MSRLAGKTAFLTAAAQGIGRATALAFAREGARVIATDVDRAGLDALARDCGATVRVLDVTDAAAIAATAREVSHGVRCNAICPGTVDSPSLKQRITAQAKVSGKTEAEVKAMFVARQPMGRLGTAEEIAALAVYLASDEAAFTTGAVMMADGGMSN